MTSALPDAARTPAPLQELVAMRKRLRQRYFEVQYRLWETSYFTDNGEARPTPLPHWHQYHHWYHQFEDEINSQITEHSENGNRTPAYEF